MFLTIRPCICVSVYPLKKSQPYVILSMPKYVIKQLTCYAHPAPVKPQHCPFSPNPITYGKDNQAKMPADDSPLLNNAGKKQIQIWEVVAKLWNGRAVGATGMKVEHLKEWLCSVRREEAEDGVEGAGDR